MSRLKLYRVEPHFSGRNADGRSRSVPGSIMTVGATDAASAARQVSHAIFNVIGHGWPVKHCYALVYEVTGDESPYGALTDDAGTWVRVTYWRGGIETYRGATYAEVKHVEEEYGGNSLVNRGVSWE